MLTFEKFTGINNVQPSHRLGDSELTEALNVDIGLSGELSRRAGFAQVSEDCHKNLYQADGYILATVSGDLTAIHPDGTRYIVSTSIGPDRVWYCDLPDGRTTYSNGLINGMTDGKTGQTWGIAAPDHAGDAMSISGKLSAGMYRHAITYVRLSDGIESAPAYGPQIEVTADGGLFASGLPVQDGHSINVYLSSGEDGFYLAGNTLTAAFGYIGENSALVLPCRTEHLSPAPVGTVSAFWRGHALIAQGCVLWASLPHALHLFDLRRGFKQFAAPITLIQVVDDGFYVGTETDLFFLAGGEFDKLQLSQCMSGLVVLGSGVSVLGEQVKQGGGLGQGSAMICIVDGHIVAGFNSGVVSTMTFGIYKTSATEVNAIFRTANGIPQYVAIPIK